MPAHTIIAPRQTAASVAEHYGLNAKSFRRWIRRNRNVSLIGGIDSPAIQGTIERYRLMASLSDLAVRGAFYAAQIEGLLSAKHEIMSDAPSWVWHVDNEYRGRGLAR